MMGGILEIISSGWEQRQGASYCEYGNEIGVSIQALDFVSRWTTVNFPSKFLFSSSHRRSYWFPVCSSHNLEDLLLPSGVLHVLWSFKGSSLSPSAPQCSRPPTHSHVTAMLWSEHIVVTKRKVSIVLKTSVRVRADEILLWPEVLSCLKWRKCQHLWEGHCIS